MKEKIKGLLYAAALIALGIIFVVKMDGWMFYIGGFIPVTNTILGGIFVVAGVVFMLAALFGRKK